MLRSVNKPDILAVTPSSGPMKMTDVKKEFDCVEFKRQAQSRIYERIRDLSPKEEIEYFRKAADEGPLGQWWKSIKDRAGPGPT